MEVGFSEGGPETCETVEKLTCKKVTEFGSRQEALQTICVTPLDIFSLPILGFPRGNRLFQQPHVFVSTGIDQIRGLQNKGLPMRWAPGFWAECVAKRLDIYFMGCCVCLLFSRNRTLRFRI